MSNSAHIKPNMKWAYIEGTLRQIAEVQLWPKAFQSSRQKPSESESVEPSALCAISSQLWRKSPDRHGFCVISSVTCRSRKFRSDRSDHFLMTCQKTCAASSLAILPRNMGQQAAQKKKAQCPGLFDVMIVMLFLFSFVFFDMAAWLWTVLLF